jgi:hypothetical protein
VRGGGEAEKESEPSNDRVEKQLTPAERHSAAFTRWSGQKSISSTFFGDRRPLLTAIICDLRK